MKYIKLFYDWIDSTCSLADDEKGRLIDAMVIYARDGVEVELPGNERFVFPVFRLQLDRDRDCYARSREDYARSREDKDQDKDKDKDKDKDQEYNEPPVLQKIDDNWRTSARARGAAAQLLVDHCISVKLPCGAMQNLHDEILGAMESGLSPAEILACCRRADARGLGLELYTAMKKRGMRANGVGA